MVGSSNTRALGLVLRSIIVEEVLDYHCGGVPKAFFTGLPSSIRERNFLFFSHSPAQAKK